MSQDSKKMKWEISWEILSSQGQEDILQIANQVPREEEARELNLGQIAKSL